MVSSEEILIEAAAAAFRARNPAGEILPSSAWMDLDAEGRVAAHDVAARSRLLEAALDPDGLSSTARAVLLRITGAGR